jgi:3-oxoadipate enol-lactonase
LPFAETKNLRMHYELDGPEHAPTLVLSNSLGTNLSLWEPQLPTLAKSFRVVRYDTRGHGQTQVTQGEYSIEQLGTDVVGLLDALKLGRVNFCGLSIGGMTGIWLGVNAPQRLEKLVLCNTAPQIGKLETWNDRIEKVRESGTQSIADQVVERWFTPEYRAKEPSRVEKTKEMITSTSSDGYAGACAAVRDFTFWDKVATIQTPTLVIAGTHDQSVPAADAQKLAQTIKGARYAELQAAHISNIEAADKFTAEVASFLVNS